MTWCGYILGFPTDTPETIARDIEIIKRELPLDILEFFFLTPLPGSEDHKNLYGKGVPMDPDLNKYDLEHVTTAHSRMSAEQWEGAYRDAWRRYYTDEHVETVLRRAAASGVNPKKVFAMLVPFSGAVRIEGLHPLQFGYLRRKCRTQRRSGLPLESPLVFYPRRAVEWIVTTTQWLALMLRYHRMLKRVLADPNRRAYMDEALRPSVGDVVDMPDFIQAHADKIPADYRPRTRVAATG
jgi:hypothetical protein